MHQNYIQKKLNTQLPNKLELIDRINHSTNHYKLSPKYFNHQKNLENINRGYGYVTNNNTNQHSGWRYDVPSKKEPNFEQLMF